MRKNKKGRNLRQMIRDYQIDNNGGIDYHELNLDDKMNYNGIYNGRRKTYFYIAPSKKEFLTPNYIKRAIKRDRVFEWENIEYTKLIQLQWKMDKDLPGLQLVFVPEFQNRFAFVSLLAFGINQISSEKALKRNGCLELMYIALLSPSTLQFYWIVDQMRSLNPVR